MKLKKNKALKITLIGAAFLIAVYFGFSTFGAYKAMTIPRLPLVYEGSSLGVPYEDVSFPSRTDNVSLKGWFLPGTLGQAVIFVHGGFQNRIDDIVDTGNLAPALVERGYNVLLYDFRGRGESGGKGRTLSHIDEDIGGGVDYLISRGFNTENINIIGFCSGAAETSIFASRNEIGSVILDGCFIDVGAIVIRQAQSINLPGWLARLFLPGGRMMSYLMYGFHRIDPVNVIPDIKAPVFFIHEEKDEFTTTRETLRMYQKAVNPARRFWEIPAAEHSRGFASYPQEYVDRVDAFLTQFR